MTPKLVAEHRRLFPDVPLSCRDGHVGPFVCPPGVPRFHGCQSCGCIVKPTDQLAHNVYLDPTVDPYDILGGGRTAPFDSTERHGWNITGVEIAVVAITILIFGVWVAVRFW